MCNCKEKEFELLPELEAILKNYAGGYQYEYETGAGKAGGSGTTVVSSPSFVRNFSGPDAECTAALTRPGKAVAHRRPTRSSNESSGCRRTLSQPGTSRPLPSAIGATWLLFVAAVSRTCSPAEEFGSSALSPQRIAPIATTTTPALLARAGETKATRREAVP